MRALVCAPSNSALDEIVMRLLAAGLRGASGEVYRPTVVRTGVQACVLLCAPWHNTVAFPLHVGVSEHFQSLCRPDAPFYCACTPAFPGSLLSSSLDNFMHVASTSNIALSVCRYITRLRTWHWIRWSRSASPPSAR